VPLHVQGSKELINVFDEDGVFRLAFMPFVFPLVVDANALRDEIIRMATYGTRTILANAANYGVIRLFCAGHVVTEVAEHLREWAEEKNLDPGLAESVWTETYLRLLRGVVVPTAELWTDVEAARLTLLATPGIGDPDDLPTANLALLLGAPLLSKDPKPLTAVYGDGLVYSAHIDWLDALSAGGDIGAFGRALYGLVLIGAVFGMAGVDAAQALLKLVPWPIAVGLSGLAAVAFWRFVPPDTKNKIVRGTKTGARVGLELLGDVMTNYAEARKEFNALAAPSSDPSDFEHSLSADATLTRSCLYYVARHPQPQLSASELHDHLQGRLEVPAGEKKLRAVLRSTPSFVEVYKGRFQLGEGLPSGDAARLLDN